MKRFLLGRLLRDELAFAKSKTWTLGMGYTHSYTATCPIHSGQQSPSTSRPKPPTVPPHYHINTHHSFILLRLASSCPGHGLVFFFILFEIKFITLIVSFKGWWVYGVKILNFLLLLNEKDELGNKMPGTWAFWIGYYYVWFKCESEGIE